MLPYTKSAMIIIIADFGEVALLPDAAVHQPHILARECVDVIGAQVWKYRFGMLARITHHVGHRSLLPPCINIGMAGLAGARAHVTSRELRLILWRRL